MKRITPILLGAFVYGFLGAAGRVVRVELRREDAVPQESVTT